MEPIERELVVSIQCSTCEGQIHLGDERCASCQRLATRGEVDALRRRWEASDPEAARRGDAVAYGRLALVIVAGLSFLEALVYGVIGESLPAFAFGVAISVAMIALYLWGKNRPLAAMVLGLAVYLLLQLLAAIASLSTLAQGILIKVLIVVALSGGIGAELSLRRYEKARSRRRAG